jgi:hypothetical protein
VRLTVRVHSDATNPGKGCLRPGDRLVLANGTLTAPIESVASFTDRLGPGTTIRIGTAQQTWRTPGATVEIERKT